MQSIPIGKARFCGRRASAKAESMAVCSGDRPPTSLEWYVALSDIARISVPNSLATEPDPKGGGGIFALRLDNGERVWQTSPAECGTRKRCSPAQSAAVSAIPGAVFSGSVDGHLRAYSTSNGSVIWDFDTVRDYETVNGVSARGGSLNVGGPAISGGIMIVNSGYAQNGIPGNVLLAFSVDGK